MNQQDVITKLIDEYHAGILAQARAAKAASIAAEQAESAKLATWKAASINAVAEIIGPEYKPYLTNIEQHITWDIGMHLDLPGCTRIEFNFVYDRADRPVTARINGAFEVKGEHYLDGEVIMDYRRESASDLKTAIGISRIRFLELEALKAKVESKSAEEKTEATEPAAPEKPKDEYRFDSTVYYVRGNGSEYIFPIAATVVRREGNLTGFSCNGCYVSIETTRTLEDTYERM